MMMMIMMIMMMMVIMILPCRLQPSLLTFLSDNDYDDGDCNPDEDDYYGYDDYEYDSNVHSCWRQISTFL